MRLPNVIERYLISLGPAQVANVLATPKLRAGAYNAPCLVGAAEGISEKDVRPIAGLIRFERQLVRLGQQESSVEEAFDAFCALMGCVAATSAIKDFLLGEVVAENVKVNPLQGVVQ